MADYQAQCSSNQYITLLLRTSVASQDVAGNTTTLSWSLHVKKSSASTSATWGNCSYGVTINGNAYSDSGQVRVEAGGDTTVLSGTTVIPHNADGTKTVNLSASISGKIVGSLSASETLITIPRQSSLAISGGTMGSPMTFKITAASSAFTHSLTYSFGSASGTILSYVDAGSHTWTPPLSLANQIPNATSGVITFTLYTWGTGVKVGQTNYTATLTVPASVAPSISSVSAAEATSGLAAKFGAYVQGKSTLKVTTSAAGSYGSTIKSCVISFDGKTYSGTSVTTSAPSKSGSQTITAKVTDSRGRTASKSITISVRPYANPAITALSVWRCTADGVADDSGDYVGITYAYTIASVNSKNDASAKIEYKRNTASSWSSLLTNSAYAVSTTVYPDQEMLSDYQWDIRLTVTDYFGSTTMTVTLPSAEVLMDLLASGDGMGIGKTAETADLLDIGWPVRARSNVKVDGTLDSPTIDYLSSFTPPAGKSNQINDCLLINTSADFSYNFMQSGWVGSDDASKISNCPVSSGQFYAVRHVYADGKNRVLVELTETLPSPGRKWCAKYAGGTWTGWNCIAPAGDYITSQGTSGSWTYRKWNSGVAECWARLNATRKATYVAYDQHSLPFAFTTFTSILTGLSDYNNNSEPTWKWNARAWQIGNNAVIVAVYAPDRDIGTGSTYHVSCHVLGRWK